MSAVSQAQAVSTAASTNVREALQLDQIEHVRCQISRVDDGKVSVKMMAERQMPTASRSMAFAQEHP